MSKPRQTSSVILVTLAELAWLAAFGLLYAYREKANKLHVLQHRIEQIGAGVTNVSQLITEREQARADASNAKARLDSFDKLLGGRSVDKVNKVLEGAKEAEEKALETQGKLELLRQELARNQKALQEAKNKLDLVPQNPAELRTLYQDATNQVASLKNRLEGSIAQINGLSNRIGQLEMGEVAIRRELIGLPAANLHRVVFIVDTSSSMRNSPAWNDARALMRMWIEYLAVEECALISFNDGASSFPRDRYQRVRERDGRILVESKAELLAAFDKASVGTFSDLLKGLRLAYRLPAPDLIVLLTDGHPHVSTQADKAFGTAILREVALHPRIPILTVAVGSYEVEGAGGPGERRNAAISFLKSLAKATEGGSFIAR